MCMITQHLQPTAVHSSTALFLYTDTDEGLSPRITLRGHQTEIEK